MTINITPKKLLKIVEILLLVVILGLLVWSQPWESESSAQTRTITVNGEGTVEAAPDEFVLSPYFQLSGTDEKEIQAQLTQQANTAVEEIKKLGVSEDKIELDASSYDYWYAREDGEGTLTIQLTITLNDEDTAQKVQDYLLTLDNIEGQLTPRAGFSKEKSKELENEATDKAIEDARQRANRQAESLNAEVGEVITVGDNGYTDGPVLYDDLGTAELRVTEDSQSSTSLPVLPGTDEYTKTINVTFELK